MVRKPSHDAIAQSIYRELKMELFTNTAASTAPYVDSTEAFVAKEYDIDGRRRADIAVQTPTTAFAFEVKTSYSDYTRYHGQALDYQKAGYEPILLATRDIYSSLGGETPPGEWFMIYFRGQMSFIEDRPEKLEPIADSCPVIDASEAHYTLKSSQFESEE